MIERAGGDVGAAADQRLQRLGPASEIADLDVQPGRFEIAQPFGNRQRQIIEQRLAAHGQLDIGLFQALRHAGAGQARTQGGNGHSGGQNDSAVQHRVPPKTE